MAALLTARQHGQPARFVEKGVRHQFVRNIGRQPDMSCPFPWWRQRSRCRPLSPDRRLLLRRGPQSAVNRRPQACSAGQHHDLAGQVNLSGLVSSDPICARYSRAPGPKCRAESAGLPCPNAIQKMLHFVNEHVFRSKSEAPLQCWQRRAHPSIQVSELKVTDCWAVVPRRSAYEQADADDNRDVPGRPPRAKLQKLS